MIMEAVSGLHTEESLTQNWSGNDMEVRFVTRSATFIPWFYEKNIAHRRYMPHTKSTLRYDSMEPMDTHTKRSISRSD